MELHQRLRELREEHGLTQQDIAEIIQTTREQVQRYELGEEIMGVDGYVRLAKYYRVSLDYLTGLIDVPRKLY